MNAVVLTDDEVTKDKISKPFLTYSVMQSFLGCPAAWYFQYILKVEGTRNWGLAFGTAWDGALNEYAKNILEGKPNNLNVVGAVFDKSFKQEFSSVTWEEKNLFTATELKKLKEKHGNELPVEVIQRARREVETLWYNFGMTKLKEYAQYVGPTLKPLYVQKRFFIDLGDSIPFGIKGTIDRIDADGTVVDNKTSKSRWSHDDVALDLQSVGYSLAYRIMTGKEEKSVRFDILVKTKTQSFLEQFQQIEMGVAPEKFDIFLQEMTNVYRMITSGTIFRNVNKFNSSCGWCEYQKLCWKPCIEFSKTSEPVLVNWYEIGLELKETIAKNPSFLQAWY